MNIQKKSAVLLVALCLLFACKKNVKESNAIKKIEIKAPIPGLEAKFEEFTVENNKNQVITTKSGTKITIPVNALVDKNGKPIEGSAKLKFREYHNAVDVLLSGIPMNIKSDGEERIMQTAGMFDIRAEQNGEEIGIAKDKKIDVRLVSFQTGTDYNVFRFDDTGRGWEFVDYNKNVEVNAEKEKLRKSIEKKNPTLAFPLDDKYFSFDYWGILDAMFKDDWNKVYENGKNPKIQSRVKEYGLVWLNTNCHELIKYQGVEMIAAMMVWKRVSGNTFPAWLKDDARDYTQLTALGGNLYQLKIESNKGGQVYNAVIEAVMPLTSLFRNTPEYWKKNYEEGLAKVQEEMKQLKFEADVYRSFEISKFGIYNYDKLLDDNDAIKIIANFNFNGKSDDLSDVYYILDDKTIIRYFKGDWGKVKLKQNATGRFVSIMKGKAVCIFTQDEYSKIDFDGLRKKDNPKYDIMMSKSETVNSADDVKKLLNF